MKRAALEEAFMQRTTLRAIEGHYVVSAFGCRTAIANALRKRCSVTFPISSTMLIQPAAESYLQHDFALLVVNVNMTDAPAMQRH